MDKNTGVKKMFNLGKIFGWEISIKKKNKEFLVSFDIDACLKDHTNEIAHLVEVTKKLDDATQTTLVNFQESIMHRMNELEVKYQVLDGWSKDFEKKVLLKRQYMPRKK